MSNIIDSAIEKMRGNWGQFELNKHGRMCGIGALAAAYNLEASAAEVIAYSLPEVEYLDRAAADETAGRVNKFYKFNDHSTTTEEDVILVMKKASALLDAEQNGDLA